MRRKPRRKVRFSFDRVTGTRSSYTRPLHQNRYCFLEAHCLTSPSKRPRPRPPTEDPNTTAATDRHASVRTVQERLPNLQQFREAGLAVTSVDQKGNRYGRENLQPVARTAEPVPPPAVKRRVVKLRPPPAFLMIKPLPATPCLPRQHDLKEGRGNGELESMGVLAPISGPIKDRPEKALPALPIRRISSKFRHAMVFPARANWVRAAPPPPVAVVKTEEPSPGKHGTPSYSQSIHHRSHRPVGMQSQSEDRTPAQADATVIKIGMVNRHELPDAWNHAISTPSYLNKALSDIVDKLESTDRRRQTAAKRSRPQLSMSCSQRLERAVAMRQRRISKGLIQESGTMEQPAQQLDSETTSLLPEAGSPRATSQYQDHAPPAAKSEVQNPLPEDDREISDRAILRGLNIVCAASANAEFDAVVQAKTGLRVRRFLAELQSFEELRGMELRGIGMAR
ncbi:hypothetical protein BT67DRAFT_85549 [Trichocladium antarcticum]|uniref:Uncharacterized protein n=1 Tax=Trichocladium antarcticum TaxID=1450529 RepID=A0AAN6UGP8_9PEZI|nr:hypothetical protein BT67DRAFT_85549 [Trichocladium antarcticum]